VSPQHKGYRNAAAPWDSAAREAGSDGRYRSAGPPCLRCSRTVASDSITSRRWLSLRDRAAAVMRDLAHRREHQRPAGGADAPAPVGLLAEEEERLVEPADRLDHRAPHHQVAARDHLDLALAVARPVAHLVAAEEGRPRQLPQARGQLQQVQESTDTSNRSAAPCRRYSAPGSPSRPRRVRVQPGDRIRQHRAMHQRVGVQQQHMPPAGDGEALVVGRGEAPVSVLRIRIACGKRSATMSAEPSVEALSTTITSAADRPARQGRCPGTRRSSRACSSSR
jgi:hypothetical protein